MAVSYDELAETAAHEASHATAAVLLGATRRAGPVTIEPDGGALGRCWSGRAAEPTAAQMLTLDRPYPLVSPAVRRRYESEAMVLLAGEIGAELHRPPREQPRDAMAARTAEGTAVDAGAPPVKPGLPAREQALIEAAAARSQAGPTDFGRAWMIMAAIHSDDEEITTSHLRFLAAETRSVLTSARAARMVQVLAAELIRVRTLPRSAWLGILRGVT